MQLAESPSDFNARRRLAGTRLGRYQVGPRLGAGGTASVYLARLSGPHNFERLVALKVVHDHLSEEREFIAQFLDEANLLVRLNHPNIVRVHELGREGHTLFLAIEYLDGQPLSKLIQRLAHAGKRMPPELVAWIGARVADGLHHAHGLTDDHGNPLALVHRDISPQNIFISYDGGVKIIDFGIARAAGRLAQTTLGKIKGKFSYMAPEQVLGSDFDHRVDLFALGATLYEAAVGTRLFAGKDETDTLHKLLFEEVPDPRANIPDFPATLAESLRKALAGKPEERYADGGHFRDDLDRYVKRTAPDVDLRERVATLMKRLFDQERLQQAAAIDELRHNTTGTHSGEMVSVASAALAPAPRRPSKAWLVAISAAVVGVVAVIAVVLGRDGRAAAPATSASGVEAPTVPTAVAIEVVVQPPVDALVEIDGQRANGRPARRTIARGQDAVTIRVSAPGKIPAELSVVPDKDRSVVVPLSDEPVKVSAPPSAESPKRQTPRPGPRPGPKPKNPGDLITNYPF
ncbi:MAG: serine/threonine-protein kinase [Polyangiaceae bacterium]